MNAMKGWVSTSLDELVHRTDSPFTASVTSFLFPTKFKMPQMDAYDGSRDPLWPPGIIQNPHASAKGSEWDYVQSLPHHSQRTSSSMVQQDNSQYHLNLQAIEWDFCHTFHWRSAIQKVLGKPPKHQVVGRQELEVVCNLIQQRSSFNQRSQQQGLGHNFHQWAPI